MRIAFPANEDRDTESRVYNHFGTARFFIIAETENSTVETVANQDMKHLHGQCSPLSALGGHKVDAVAVGGIGAGALQKLTASGIRTYRAVEGTVQENLELIKSGLLPEFTLNQTCAGHGEDGHCAH